MPRQPDPQVEERILNAARKLWKKGGEKALSMRAVARAAGTNTPALYRRFPSRVKLLQSLLRRVQQEVVDVVGPCGSAEEACEKYLDFALSHPHDYELFYDHAYHLPRPPQFDRPAALRQQRPTMALMEVKLAERLGGSPEDHARLSLALWAITHGTAMILISKSIPPEHASELRSVFSSTVATMIRNASV
jgi:AcrR family transcriptional regulator